MEKERRRQMGEKKTNLRNFDLFCLLNSCGAGGSCDPLTIYCILLGLDEIDLNEKPPPAPHPHWLLYLNGTNYGVTISYYHPYFYSLSNSWRRFQIAGKVWADKIANFEKGEWDNFAQRLNWCHHFPLTLAFLTYRAWKLGGGEKIEIKQETVSPTEIGGKEEIIEGLAMVSILKRSEDKIYLTTIQKSYITHNSSRMLTFIKFVGDKYYELARWLGHVSLLTADNLLHQLPGRKSKSRKKVGRSSVENV
jgi:hypothetical protein